MCFFHDWETALILKGTLKKESYVFSTETEVAVSIERCRECGKERGFYIDMNKKHKVNVDFIKSKFNVREEYELVENKYIKKGERE